MATNKGYSKNIEQVAFHDLNGNPGFQMAMQKANDKWYLYICGRNDVGWHILDVTKPDKPRYVRFVKGPDKPGQRGIKIQVADGIMVTQLQNGIEGIYIWDVKTDPENPKFLSHWSTGDPNGYTHRFFYNGGRYIHLSSTCKGFAAMIYRIVDIHDPRNPVEAGRFWKQEQWMGGLKAYEREAFTKKWDAQVLGVWAGLHGPPYVKGNLAFCSWGVSGMVILDVSDISMPQMLGSLSHHPPFAGGLCGAWCHTVVPMSGKPYAIMTSEGERFPLFTKEILKPWPVPPMALVGMVDVSDPSNPTLIATFPYPEVPPGFPFKNFNDMGLGVPGPFGPHNVHEPHFHPDLEDRQDRTYITYFHAGLRIYDISDPYYIKEIAYFIPPNPAKGSGTITLAQDDPTFSLRAQPRGPLVATTEEVIVDKRGNIFMDAMYDGLYVLKATI